jgi:hypothetical protein
MDYFIMIRFDMLGIIIGRQDESEQYSMDFSHTLPPDMVVDQR